MVSMFWELCPFGDVGFIPRNQTYYSNQENIMGFIELQGSKYRSFLIRDYNTIIIKDTHK